MSPIRASERARYPANWREVRISILARARLRCECDGRCGSPHCRGAATYPTRLYRGTHRCSARHGEPHPSTGSRVVLTVAHLDHQPEHCDPANLLAMCQACHLAYDREHHAETRRARQQAVPQTRVVPQSCGTNPPVNQGAQRTMPEPHIAQRDTTVHTRQLSATYPGELTLAVLRDFVNRTRNQRRVPNWPADTRVQVSIGTDSEFRDFVRLDVQHSDQAIEASDPVQAVQDAAVLPPPSEGTGGALFAGEPLPLRVVPEPADDAEADAEPGSVFEGMDRDATPPTMDLS